MQQLIKIIEYWLPIQNCLFCLLYSDAPEQPLNPLNPTAPDMEQETVSVKVYSDL